MLFTLSLCVVSGVFAQNNTLWQDIDGPIRPQGQRAIVPQQYRTLRLNTAAMLERLAEAPDEQSVKAFESDVILELPTPDGRLQAYRICESPIMAPGLEARFPTIKTYLGKGVDNPSASLRLDYTPQGFHAMVLDGAATFFIDPYYHLLNEGTYQSYFQRDFKKEADFECLLEPDATIAPEEGQGHAPAGPVGETLRTYRLAVSATGEYTQYHGGTVDGAMAAIVTSMNRVNGVYERDISCRMILIDSNHLLVFIDPSEDPFSGDPGNHLGQNQTAVDQIIGTANYDIGHVFHRAGGGGVAFLSAVCSSENKARGFTSTTNPVGDPYDIDYVAHEMGHQFGANHTQNNNCNRNGNTAMEPGSASTIMGYAGICPPDLQNNSDAYFHSINLQEMIVNTTSNIGSSCPELIPTGNTAPMVEAGPSGEIIPRSTPFELTGFAEDMEGDSLAYCWEQFDLGPSASPNNPVGNSPIFRSFNPTTNPTRVFPRLPDLVNNTSTIGELLPGYARNLNFRLSVRDNHGFGGGVEWDNRTLTVTDQAGPFRVLSQNTATTWSGGAFENIIWDVAKTDQAPVAAGTVDIFLSEDGGYTYPFLLANGVPNVGNALVQVPDSLQGTTFRIKVKASGRVFFDINNTNITIEPPLGPGIAIGAPSPSQLACGGQAVLYSLRLAPLLGFSDTVTLAVEGLPGGLSAQMEGPFTLPAQTELSITGTENLPSGTYPFLVIASSGGIADTVMLSLQLYQQAPAAVELLSPTSAETGTSVVTTFSWQASPDALDYKLEVAFDPLFEDILFATQGITETNYQPELQLPDSTTLFWRVQGRNPVCGAGEYAVDYFSTEVIRCNTYSPDLLPVSLETAASIVFSRVEVADDIIVRDVNIRNLRGEHTPLSGLNFRFGSPEGPVIDLITEDCNSGSGFNLGLDDEAAAAVPCPFNNGNTYRPEDKLSIYDGQNAQGTWRLILFKSAFNGSLQDWQLEICYSAPLTSVRESRLSVPGLHLFPNPAREQISVELPLGLETGAIVEVSSVRGEKLLQSTVQAGQRAAVLQLDGLPEGLYFLQLTSREGQVLGNGKFIHIKR